MKKIIVLVFGVIIVLGLCPSGWALSIPNVSLIMEEDIYSFVLEGADVLGKTKWVVESETIQHGDWMVTVYGELDPDPYIAYWIAAKNLSSTPLTFQFAFLVPINMPEVGTVVFSSVMGSLTDGTGNGVSIVPAGFYLQGAYVFDPLTNLGVVLGESLVAGPGESGAIYDYGPFVVGPEVGPSGNWDTLETIVSFQLSGNNDLAVINGYFRLDPDPVPEPLTMVLVGSGLFILAGYGRRKVRKP